MMTRPVAAEFRKLLTTRLWLWLLASVGWTAGYTALAIALSGGHDSLSPPLTSPAGQHALYAIGAGGVAPLAAVLGAAVTAGEYRRRTAAVTFLVQLHRARVIAAKLAVCLSAGAAHAVARVAVGLAVALPWLSARGIVASPARHGDLAVLGAIVISSALFAVTGAGLGALLGGEIGTITCLLLYLYVVEPLISRVTVLGRVTAWVIAVACAGTAATVRRDIT